MSTELHELFQASIADNPDPAALQMLEEHFPLFALTSPRMPLPGPNFVAAAINLGDPAPTIEGAGKHKHLTSCGKMLSYLYRRALYDENFSIAVDVKGQPKITRTVPGHLYGAVTDNMSGGPRPAKVMILGKNPGQEELREHRNFVGPAAEILLDVLDELGINESERYQFYVTNLIKWPNLDLQSDSIPQAQKKDMEIILEQEIRLVRPDYILCLGSDASKFLLGKSYGVQSMVGRVMPHTVAVYDDGDTPMYHTAQVMTATHPAAVHRTPELYPEFRDQIRLFFSLVNGADVGGREKNLRHRNIYKHRELKALVDEIRNDPDPERRIIAVDGEWEGDYPTEPGAYLRTVQFSSRHGEGICVVLRHQGGEPAFQPSMSHAIHELRRLLKTDEAAGYRPRVGGHFLRADLPWLIHEGLDLREEYAPPDEVAKCREEGGWDTGLMYHAFNETASYRLTDMTVRLTQAPVYDARLKQHITDYCAAHDIKKDDLEGFGFLPSWILHPEPTDPEWGDNYAQYDADVTRRIAMRHLDDGGLLDKDWFENTSWEPYWRSHRASLGVLEMEMAGISLDSERVDELTMLFMQVRDSLLEDFRTQINWPTFNPASSPQCVALLFGDRYGKKKDKRTGQQISIRPQDAATFNLTPIKTTGKRSKLWADIITRNETHLYTPSTDKEVLGILGHAHPLIMQLRDLKFISQVLKSVLREPMKTSDGMNFERQESGHLVFEKGLAGSAHADGKIRTHISQNKETGRSSSSRPPLQNLSKRREGDYARILGEWGKDKETSEKVYKGSYQRIFPTPLYKAPIRSILRASPGYVLVEADYTGAELAMIAWLAGDANMIEHVRRNALPESHDDYYDVHAQTAVRTFQLQCEPTKKGLKDAGYAPLRVAAKNVNFGIPYGRSAEAIARQCREEGVDVTEHECQQMIEFYFTQYPGTGRFLEECETRTQEDQWIAGPFGRFRRFINSRDRGVQGEQRRQGRNFPIQNGVADAVWTAIYNFTAFRSERPDVIFKMLLQIHDAILFEVPVPHLAAFVDDQRDELGNVVAASPLRECLVQRVPIWPRRLDNTVMPVAAPYFFGIDADIEENWGVPLSTERAEELGIPLSLVA